MGVYRTVRDVFAVRVRGISWHGYGFLAIHVHCREPNAIADHRLCEAFINNPDAATRVSIDTKLRRSVQPDRTEPNRVRGRLITCSRLIFPDSASVLSARPIRDLRRGCFARHANPPLLFRSRRDAPRLSLLRESVFVKISLTRGWKFWTSVNIRSDLKIEPVLRGEAGINGEYLLARIRSVPFDAEHAREEYSSKYVGICRARRKRKISITFPACNFARTNKRVAHIRV